MPNLPKEPTIGELLDRMASFEAENAKLKTRIDDLLEGFKFHVDGDADKITRIYDLLWPLVDKVFPQFREMQKKIDAVVPPCWADPSVDRRLHERKRS